MKINFYTSEDGKELIIKIPFKWLSTKESIGLNDFLDSIDDLYTFVNEDVFLMVSSKNIKSISGSKYDYMLISDVGLFLLDNSKLTELEKDEDKRDSTFLSKIIKIEKKEDKIK